MRKKILGIILVVLLAFAGVGCDFMSGLGGGGGSQSGTKIDLNEVYLNVSSQIQNKNSVTENLPLPTKFGDVSITWRSDNPSVISNSGVVTRPDVDTNVSLQCTLEYGSDKQTYTILVTVKAKENTVVQPTSFSTIAQAKVGTIDDYYLVKATVVAVGKESFLIKDSTGTMLVYFGESFAKDVVVGNEVEVKGQLKSYNNTLQLSNADYRIVSRNQVAQPTPRVLSARDLETLAGTGAGSNEYVQVEGVLVISGKYINLQVEGANVQGSIQFLNDLTSLNGKKVVATGYYLYTQGNGQYVALICTDVTEVEDQTTTPVETPVSSISQVLAGTVSNKYKIEGTVVATSNNSFIVKDSSGVLLVYAGNGYAKDLVVGDKVLVEGKLGTHTNCKQLTEPTYEKEDTVSVTQPNARSLAAADVDALVAQTTATTEYIKVEGVLRISGSYLNLEVEGTNSQISIATSEDFSALGGKKLAITGYYVYISGSSVKYVNVIVTDYEVLNEEAQTIELSTIAQALAGEVGKTYKVKAVVIARGDGIYVIQDATGLMTVNVGSGSENQLTVGTEAFFEGQLKNYANTVQLNYPTCTTTSSASSVSHPTPVELDAEAFEALDSESAEIFYAKLEGTLTISNNKYFNIAVEGSNLTGSIVKPVQDISELNNKKVSITGYYIYTLTSSGRKFVYFVATGIEEVVEIPVISDEEIVSSVVDAISFYDNMATITGFALPTEASECSITWTSANAEVIDNTGAVVSIPAEDTSVEFSVVVAKGDVSSTTKVTLIAKALSTCAQLHALTDDDLSNFTNYGVKVVVVYVHECGFLGKDDTGYILMYNESYAHDLVVGDEVILTGFVSKHGDKVQFGSASSYKKTGNTVTVEEPTYAELDAFGLDDIMNNNDIRPLSFVGTLTVSGQYINIYIDDSTVAACPLADGNDYTTFNGKLVKVTGYYIYITGGNRYAYFAVTSLEEYVPLSADLAEFVENLRAFDGIAIVTGLNLPASDGDFTLTWTSSNEALITSDGRVVALPEENTPVKFTVVVAKGSESATVEINLVAKAASTCAELQRLTEDEMAAVTNWAVKGIVAYKYNYGFVVKDDTGYITVYKGNSFADDVNVGDEVLVKGFVEEYGGNNQFTVTARYEVLSTGHDVDTSSSDLTAEQINDIFSNDAIRVVKVKGTIVMTQYANLIVDGAEKTVSLVADGQDYYDYDSLHVIVTGYYLFTNGNDSQYVNIGVLSVDLDPDFNQPSVSPRRAVSAQQAPHVVNQDGSWSFHVTVTPNAKLVNPSVTLIDLIAFGYENGDQTWEEGAPMPLYYGEESIIAQDQSNLEVTYDNGVMIIDFTVPAELVTKYTSEYYYDIYNKGGLYIDLYLEVLEDGTDISLEDNYYFSLFFFKSFLDVVPTTGSGTEADPLTAVDAYDLAEYLPARIWSNAYFFVEGTVTGEVTENYCNFYLKSDDSEKAFYVYGLSTPDELYKYGSAYGKVDGIPFAEGDTLLIACQVYHYQDKEGNLVHESNNAFLVKVNGEAVTYELVPENPNQPVHSGTEDDPFDAADALLMASKLDAASKEKGEVYAYFEGSVASDVTTDFCNFSLGDGDNKILVYGLWDADGVNRYGSRREIAELPIAPGDYVLLFGRLQNYSGTLEIIEAQLMYVYSPDGE